MSDALVVIGFVAFSALISLPIVLFVARTFRAHDPARALVSVTVSAAGPFELPVPESARVLFFRFEIDGDTDSDYDLLVRGEIVDRAGKARTFAVKTLDKSKIEGASEAQQCSTIY